MSPDAQRLQRAAKLAEKQTELLAHLHDVTVELRKILAGQAALGDLMRQATATWLRAWAAEHNGDKYVWMGAKDSSILKRLLGAMSVQEVERRMCEYLADKDPFIEKAGHPLSLFSTRVNRYVARGDESGTMFADADETAKKLESYRR